MDEQTISTDTATDVNTLETEVPKTKKRIWELDFIRGFLILLMVVDHLMVTVAYFYGPEWFVLSEGASNGFTTFYNAALYYCNHPARAVIEPIVVMIFLALCGLSTGFSRNNLKRGCELGLLALAITAVTYALPDKSLFISFGILHHIAFCILVWSALSATVKKDKYACLIVGLTVSFTIFGLYFAAQSDINFKNKLAGALFILIQTDATFDFSPADFFPLIPWAGMFFMAAAVSPFLYPEKTSKLPKLDGKWNKPLCFVGRHTLIIYALHLFLIVAVLELVSYAAFHTWLIAAYF